MYQYDKDEIKENLSIDEIEMLVNDLNGEPIKQHSTLLCKTICHCGEQHKLYYYDNTKLFRCYTDCSSTFDVFELVCKVMTNNGHYKVIKDKEGREQKVAWGLHDAVRFVAKYFGISASVESDSNAFHQELEDWKILESYEKSRGTTNTQKRELKYYDEKILKYLPQPIIQPWVNEGIKPDVMRHCGIRFDPVNCGIIIPHYSPDNQLLGIRTRTLIKEEEVYGKYRPAYLNGKLYNHPLSFNLYNLNNSKEHIKDFGIAIVFESEKSPLLYQSYFGIENDISVAVCGFNILSYQMELLRTAGAKEVVIAFDKQFQDIGDEEWKKLKDKYYKIHEKFGDDIQISYIFDFEGLLNYKDSPIDQGPEIFMKLFKERIII